MAQIEAKPGSSSSLDSSNNKVFVMAVLAVVVLGLAAVAYFASNRSDDTAGGEDDSTVTAADDTSGSDDTSDSDGTNGAADGADSAAVTLDGASLEPLPEGVRISDADSDPLFGSVAPTLTGTGFDGSEVTIGPDGSPKAIYFVAHWCPHCQAEIPLVQQLIDDGKVPDGFKIYAVSTAVNSGQGNYPPAAWFSAEGFNPAVVRDDEDSSAFQAFGGAGFPYALYLDGENRIVARSTGSLDGPTTEQLWQSAASAG